MKSTVILFLVISFLLSSCATTPEALKGEFSNISPAQAKADHRMNVNVRWAGYIVQTLNKKDKTCFEIVQTQTNKNMRPQKIIAKNSSRFLACKEGFLEPHAFDKRMVTITGNLVAYTQQKIGEYDYEYPVVKTDVIYIWRKQPPRINNPYFFNSFGGFSNFHCLHSFIPGYCF